jgi:ubiquinone/menaquinone biosynthesis C-methylase UbiE
MNSTFPSVDQQYARTGLFESILEALAKTGIGKDAVTRTSIAGVDEFHVRGRAVSEELAAAAAIPHNAKVLDVGCGIGGTSRMLAAEYGCMVTGVDVIQEYIRTATLLSELVGLQQRTHFVHGSALALPFPDDHFDMVWTQHVQMNIADKQTFYAEIKRMLLRTGRFVYYDIFSTGHGQLQYPVPWADTPELSHLITTGELKVLLQQNGLQPVSITDQTEKGIQSLAGLIKSVEQHGVPAVGLNLLMGERFREKIMNLHQNLTTGSIMLQSGICKA